MKLTLQNNTKKGGYEQMELKKLIKENEITEKTMDNSFFNDNTQEEKDKIFEILTSGENYYDVLSCLNRIIPGCYGVEAILVKYKYRENKIGRDYRDIEYLNTGDTYSTTIIYCCGTYCLLTYGDLIENEEGYIYE